MAKIQCSRCIQYPDSRHCEGLYVWCDCGCKYLAPIRGELPLKEIESVLETINYYKENLMPNEYTESTPAGVRPFRCIAYKPEAGADVTEKTVVATNKDQAQNLFAAEVGTEAIMAGTVIEVFPMR